MRKVTNYERFERHIEAWAAHEIDCLAVIGPPGTGKSRAYQHVLGERPYHLFGGRKTPIQVYCELYDNPGWPVVFDDISALLRDHNFIDMLKGLCETGKKVIRWGTSTRLLEGRATSFVSTSPVLIVLNRLPEKNQDVQAVLDRCDGIEFSPTKAEILNRMRSIWSRENALVDLMADLPVMPTLRTMVKALQWKRSKHLNLTEELLSECGVPDAVRVLIDIMAAEPRKVWCARYVEATKRTERTFRRDKRIAEEILACRQRGQTDTETQTPAEVQSRPMRVVAGAA